MLYSPVMAPAMPPEIKVTMGPRMSKIAVETIMTSSSGTKIERTTVGTIFFNHGSTMEANQAATMIGKIE